MELDIVMLNVLMIWNSFGDRLIVKTGKMIRVIMVLVVLNLMFGKLTNMLMLILLILVKLQDIIDVKEVNVEMVLKDKMEYVIKMDVILVLSEMDIENFMDLEVHIMLILLRKSLLLLNLSLLIILILEICWKFRDSMFKMVKKYLSLMLMSQALILTTQLLMETVENRRKYLDNLRLLLRKEDWKLWEMHSKEEWS